MIKGQLEGIVKHSRQVLTQKLITLLETWICIYLNKPRNEVFVNQKIISKNLKAIFTIVLVNFEPH